MAFLEVMLPNRPVLHHVAALHVLEAAIGRPLEITFVNQSISLSDDDLYNLSNRGIFPIGVGSGRLYKDRGFGSETAVIVHELRSVGKILQKDKVLDDLVTMMDLNNNHQSRQGGYLRRQPYSVAWIMRQGYRLGNDPSEVEFSSTDEEVVRRVMHVVASYLEANRRNGSINLGAREQAMCTAAMQLLPGGDTANKGPRNHQGPMTVSRYIRDMFVLGLSEDEMLEKAEWFVRVHDRAKERQVAARKRIDAGGFSMFELPGYTESGTWIDSDDPYLLEDLAKTKSHPLVVMRSSRGNVIIMSVMFDLSGAASLFLSKEQCWYYQASPQFLANGTEGVEDIPTVFSREVIESGLGETVCYK